MIVDLAIHEPDKDGGIQNPHFHVMCPMRPLKEKIENEQKQLDSGIRDEENEKLWLDMIQEYANITELDADMLNRLIKEIIVHEKINEKGERDISAEIHFNLKPVTYN